MNQTHDDAPLSIEQIKAIAAQCAPEITHYLWLIETQGREEAERWRLTESQYGRAESSRGR